MKKISCLPVAGIGNPYQYLMIEGLQQSKDLKVESGIDDKFFGIIRTAISQKPDYIHFDWITSYYYRKWLIFSLVNIPIFILQVLMVKYLMGIKLVWTLHNIEPHDLKYKWIHKINRQFFAGQVNWIRVFSEGTISKAKMYLNVSDSKFRVLPEGSYENYYPPIADPKSAYKNLGLTKGKTILLFFGLIKPYKGIVELARLVNNDYSNQITLLIAGKSMDENYGALLKSQVSNAVIWHDNFVDREAVSEYFYTADLVVFPFSKIENSGSVILAMGYGKVILAPKMGVLKKRLKQQSEFLYEPGYLKVGLDNVLATSKDLEKIGLQNKKILNKSSWADLVNFFIED